MWRTPGMERGWGKGRAGAGATKVAPTPLLADGRPVWPELGPGEGHVVTGPDALERRLGGTLALPPPEGGASLGHALLARSRPEAPALAAPHGRCPQGRGGVGSVVASPCCHLLRMDLAVGATLGVSLGVHARLGLSGVAAILTMTFNKIATVVGTLREGARTLAPSVADLARVSPLALGMVAPRAPASACP